MPVNYMPSQQSLQQIASPIDPLSSALQGYQQGMGTRMKMQEAQQMQEYRALQMGKMQQEMDQYAVAQQAMRDAYSEMKVRKGSGDGSDILTAHANKAYAAGNKESGDTLMQQAQHRANMTKAERVEQDAIAKAFDDDLLEVARGILTTDNSEDYYERNVVPFMDKYKDQLGEEGIPEDMDAAGAMRIAAELLAERGETLGTSEDDFNKRVYNLPGGGSVTGGRIDTELTDIHNAADSIIKSATQSLDPASILGKDWKKKLNAAYADKQMTLAEYASKRYNMDINSGRQYVEPEIRIPTGSEEAFLINNRDKPAVMQEAINSFGEDVVNKILADADKADALVAAEVTEEDKGIIHKALAAKGTLIGNVPGWGTWNTTVKMMAQAIEWASSFDALSSQANARMFADALKGSKAEGLGIGVLENPERYVDVYIDNKAAMRQADGGLSVTQINNLDKMFVAVVDAQLDEINAQIQAKAQLIKEEPLAYLRRGRENELTRLRRQEQELNAQRNGVLR